jgi:hypothetical protein
MSINTEQEFYILLDNNVVVLIKPEVFITGFFFENGSLFCVNLTKY